MAKRILIVDDEPNIVISLEFLMKREGFEVAIAGDGETALRLVAEHRPDLVLLDVMMPKERLRGLPGNPRAPRLAGHEDHHAHRQGARDRDDQGHGARCRHLHDQALLHEGTGDAREAMLGA